MLVFRMGLLLLLVRTEAVVRVGALVRPILAVRTGAERVVERDVLDTVRTELALLRTLAVPALRPEDTRPSRTVARPLLTRLPLVLRGPLVYRTLRPEELPLL